MLLFLVLRANLFPEIKDQLVVIFERYRHVLDAELQQRACEYLAIVSRDDDDELLQAVFEEMPPFPARESALLNRLHKKGKDTEDKRTWVIGGKEENKEREAARFKTFRKGSVSAVGQTNGAPSSPVAATSQQDLTPPPPPPPERSNTLVDTAMGVSSSSATEDIMDSLAGLDLSNANSLQQERLLPDSSSAPSSAFSPSNTASYAPSAPTPLTHGANIDKWFDRLSYTGEGVLYEDAQIQIGVKSEFHGHLGRVQLYFGNKISVPFNSFTVAVECANPQALTATLATSSSTSTVAPLTQIQQQIQVECKNFFSDPPVVKITYLAGSMQTLVLRLPVTITKFIEPVKLGQADFFERWKLIGGAPRESQSI